MYQLKEIIVFLIFLLLLVGLSILFTNTQIQEQDLNQIISDICPEIDELCAEDFHRLCLLNHEEMVGDLE